MKTNLTGNEIRKQFINFFTEKAGHTFVRSSSLVPGGDSTLLFNNAGMVQFKDVFLGTDLRAYTRAVNAQKCLRVAGKHNDLEDVGRDDTHHTFFEMLGNWSFGDYYKKEAIAWAWELLTEVWGIPKDQLYATVFRDEQGEIPTDEEAAGFWRQQPGFNPDHLFYLGRKDNFWEMADTGPCGPCSEIHIDLRPGSGPVDAAVLDSDRFIELWNLVFIQYNRLSPAELTPLPATHVDTGMGLERIVSVLQNKNSNYRTDLLWPLIEATRAITEHSDEEIAANFTPYRVIADHGRAATFMVADGVVPGNLGRNYVTRMIIRRAYRFAGKLGIHQPFLGRVAQTVIDFYGEAYPELVQNQETILTTITREEEQFQRTLDKAMLHLEELIETAKSAGKTRLSGQQAADLLTTYGMPFEITRDIAEEHGMTVSEAEFQAAMEAHRLASGAGKAMGALGGEDVEIYRHLRADLQTRGKLPEDGVAYNPYGNPQDLTFDAKILALVSGGQPVERVSAGDDVEILLPQTRFYIESGGQINDTGWLRAPKGAAPWEIEISGLRQPAAGIIIHVGKVKSGSPRVGETVVAQVDTRRRLDIMRNHTATHLLHTALHRILGSHARQAGSLVASDRLRFDFTHPEALTVAEIEAIETYVNERILENHDLHTAEKSLDEALAGGATALFGEKYAETVRNITIGNQETFSNELCGGTHLERTGDTGTFIIVSEGSVAAGVRRIEAVTGRQAYQLIKRRFRVLNEAAAVLATTPEQIFDKIESQVGALKEMRNQIADLRQKMASANFEQVLDSTEKLGEIDVLTAQFNDADVEALRKMADRFRQRHPENGVAVLASVVNERPMIIAAVTENLISRGIKAGDLAGYVARQLGGGGGGKPTLAQAGGKNTEKLPEALASVRSWVAERLK